MVYCTADDMGLGKTLTMIALALRQKQQAGHPAKTDKPITNGRLESRVQTWDPVPRPLAGLVLDIQQVRNTSPAVGGSATQILVVVTWLSRAYFLFICKCDLSMLFGSHVCF